MVVEGGVVVWQQKYGEKGFSTSTNYNYQSDNLQLQATPKLGSRIVFGLAAAASICDLYLNRH